MKLGFALCAACLASVAFAKKGGYETDAPERYIQCYKGEIQILPALTKDEMPHGHVSGVEGVGGFVFDLEWKENKMTKMRVLSKEGGVCRIRSYAGIGSPLMRKAKHDCANAAIAATKDRVRGPETPESVFDRADHPLPSVCFDFDTEPGEVLEFRGVSGNQDWTDYSKSLPDRFLTTAEAARIAQNVLDWQLDTGGWPKNVPMQEKLTAKERAAVLALKGDRKRGTIDNAATFAELNFLARMYRATERADYLDGVKRGIGFLLYLQYPNGGWPQCDPAKEGYWHQITFNDGAMVNVMNALRLVYEARPPFDIPLPEETRDAAKAAFAKGVACILKTQIRQNGRRTVWCQQHDRDTLAPCTGRAFELPSCCSMESMDIVRLLMTLDPADYPETGAVKFSEIRAAIEGARDWYAANPVRGYRVEHGWRRPDGIVSGRLVKDPDAPPLWCRYYTLEDNRPFAGRRDGTKDFDFSEMERGENMSYMWFNSSGEAMAREYPRWEKRIERKLALAVARKNAKTTEWRGGKGNGDMPYIPPEKDTWENPANWSNGVPGEEDTVVFARDATLWSTKRGEEPYLCGRLILKNGANVALRSNYEANGAANPNFRPRAVEGAGTITLCCAGLSPKEGETLIVPKSIAVVAAGTEGRGSFLNAPERGRLVVEGKVSCPGNKLRVFDDVTLAGELDGYERMEIDAGATVKNPPKLPPKTIEVNGTSLQSAIDAIPAHAQHTYIVKIAPGRYREKVKIPANKCNIRFVAADPRPGSTVVSWNDTPATPGPNGKGLGTSGSYTLSVEGSDIEFDGFTIENTGTPERLAATGGKEQAGQCVALFVKGDRCAFRNCRILGWQDTVFAGGEVGASPARQYFEKCYIEGSVDFIFGGSVALFNDCELHSHQGGYVTAGSHAPDLPFGYVFVKCRVTCGGGKQTSLGRPWRPFANVTFVASDFGTAVAPHGWNDWTTDCGRRVYRSAEYGCTHKGDYRREPWIEVGSLTAFKKRLVAAGMTTIPDILKSADDWRPMRSCVPLAVLPESPAVQMLESEMTRMPVPCDIDKRKKPKWEYTDGLELQGALAVGAAYPAIRAKARAWAQDYIDRMVTPEGEILGYPREQCKLDSLNTGKFAFDMYELAVREGNAAEATRLKKALDSQFAQFAIQPRTSEGGFWHKTVYPHQMWLDGLYMGAPFYARYAATFLDGKARDTAFADVLNQFEVVMRHTYDPATGLYRHGWDEAKAQIWADKETGQSAHAWGRALGWFAAAMAETLEYLPEDVKGRDTLVRRFQGFARSLEAWQDKSGAWWQIADQPGREGNYLEATATALIGYALMKGSNRGWLDGSARETARRALAALQRDFLRSDSDGTVSLTRCCAVAGLSKDRDGSFAYYLREPIRDNDAKGTGSYLLLCLEAEKAPKSETPLERRDVQAAIDAAAAQGGGRVVVPAGVWETGAIHLKSHVELHLEDGATLVFTERLEDYLPAVRTSWEGVECMGYSPLIYAYDCTNVAVTGKGTLTARVEDRWRAWGLNRKKNPAHDAANRLLKADWAYGEKPVEARNFWQLPESLMRPVFIQFNRCTDVWLEGVKIRESPFWTIHLLCCDGATVRGVDSFATCKNSDGIDIESSRNVLVEDCVFEQGDDAVAIKSGLNHEGRRRASPSENIVIRNCVVNEGHAMLSIGSELSGGIRNVLMEDCRSDSDIDKVFFIKTNPERGGFVENVTMRRIRAKGVRYPLVSAITDYFWKPDMTTADGILRATPVSGITLEDIKAESASEVYSFRGYPTEPIRNLTLRNVQVAHVKRPSSAEYVVGLRGVETAQ